MFISHSVSRVSKLRIPALVFAVLAQSGCSALLEGHKEQCTQASDCTDLGFAGATCQDGVCVKPAAVEGPWSCVGKVKWPTSEPSVPASLSIGVIRLVGQTPFEGLTVKTCPPLDVECANPMGETTSGADGILKITVFKGFNGHILAPAPVSYPEMVPMLLYLFPPPSGNEPEVRPGKIALTTFKELTGLAGFGGKTITSGLGHIFFTAVDCQGQLAAGVTVKVDTLSPTTSVVYVAESGVPSATVGETSSKGEGVILNVPAGYVTMTASSPTTGKFMSSTIAIKPNHITGIPARPTELPAL